MAYQGEGVVAYRLVLLPDGQGGLASGTGSRAAAVYAVKWKISDRSLLFSLSQMSGDPVPIELEGEVLAHISLLVKGPGWQRKVSMQRESPLLKTAARLKDEMDQYLPR